jgi:hypothetical protein
MVDVLPTQAWHPHLAVSTYLKNGNGELSLFVRPRPAQLRVYARRPPR